MNIALVTGGETGEREVSLASAANVEAALGFAEVTRYVFPEDFDRFQEEVTGFDLVVPVIHGVGGEDGEFQEYLDSIDIPYFFSGPKAHAIAIDKLKTKELVSRAGILSPKSMTPNEIEPPCFIKPKFGGSSVDTCLAKTKAEAESFLNSHKDQEMMIEQAVQGRELTVGVVDGIESEPQALPVIEIKPGSFLTIRVSMMKRIWPKRFAQL